MRVTDEQRGKQNLESMLRKHDLPVPARMTRATLQAMEEAKSLAYSRADTYEGILRELELLGKRVLVLDERWAVPIDENNALRKDLSLDAYVMLGRKEQVLPYLGRAQRWKLTPQDRTLLSNYRRNGELSERLVQLLGLMPEDLLSEAKQAVDDPKLGYAYRNLHGKFVSTTWAALWKGYQVYRQDQKKGKTVQVTQTKPYAGCYQARVLNGDGEWHQTEFYSIPITAKGKTARREIRAWNLEAHCTCKDYSFVGVQHHKQAQPMIRGCKHLTASYHAGRDSFHGMQDEYQGQSITLEWHGNAFPKPSIRGLALTKKFATRVLIRPVDGPLRALNDTEFSLLFGAYVAKNGVQAYLRI